MIGEGGERTARASLAAAAFVGYRLLHPATAEATTLFGSAVPGGPLDAAAQIVVDDPTALPIPITVLIEVKNIRDWIYPDAAELYQLLDKAARLQLAHPAQRLLPVLICRRAQYLTWLMAADLGFFVITTTSQAILPHSQSVGTNSSPPRAPSRPVARLRARQNTAPCGSRRAPS